MRACAQNDQSHRTYLSLGILLEMAPTDVCTIKERDQVKEAELQERPMD